MLKGQHSSGYHHVRHYSSDRDEAVLEFEEHMWKYCKTHALDFGTIDKYDLAKKLGFHREYYRALRGKDDLDFAKGY